MTTLQTTRSELETLLDPQLLDEADYGRSILRSAILRGEIR